jgi:hypothetical protein
MGGHLGEEESATCGRRYLLRAGNFETSPMLGVLPKSTSPARKDRKVGLDKKCLLMEVRRKEFSEVRYPQRAGVQVLNAQEVRS